MFPLFNCTLLILSYNLYINNLETNLLEEYVSFVDTRTRQKTYFKKTLF